MKMALLIVGCVLGLATVGAQPAPVSRFLFGVTAYPDLLTWEQSKQMLDEFEKAHFNVIRVGESSWGNLEPAPGKYTFGWLRDFLDELERRHMKAILGTCSYNPPPWLVAKHPDMLVELQPGVRVHPLGRKAASLTHPLYREAVRRYVRALATAFKDHPAVIGWQLDNEIDIMMDVIDYSPVNERSWRDWLQKTFESTDQFNRRLFLASWGQKIDSFDEVPQPRQTGERHELPALSLANYHFRRDVMIEFFREQTKILREAGVKQWIMTDTTPRWLSISDDPGMRDAVDIAAFNFYQPNPEPPRYGMELAWHFDKERSAHGLGQFLSSETRIGVIGDTIMWDPFPTHDQYRMWMFQPLAFGSVSLMYWSGNRWRGGPWPQFGGVLDWTGKPEPDVEWLKELGMFLDKWGQQMVDHPVKSSAAVLTDFDQRAALQVYRHTPGSMTILPESFEALHRIGAGVDGISSQDAANVEKLRRYSLIVLAANTALDGTAIPAALEKYVQQGGNVLITQFTAYQDRDGVFRGDGFGANLTGLTGTLVRTVRKMGTSADNGRKDQMVAWSMPGMQALSAVGADGFCEYGSWVSPVGAVAHASGGDAFHAAARLSSLEMPVSTPSWSGD